MSDIETRLADQAQHWQQGQPPPPDLDPARFAQRPHSWVPLAVAAAVVAIVAAAVAIPVGLRGGTAKSDTLVPSAVTATAPVRCPSVILDRSDGANAITRLPDSELPTVLAGHLPASLPSGFGLLAVGRSSPIGNGIAEWTDASCRRVEVSFTPGGDRVDSPATHLFGPWMQLQNCGRPAPCFSYEAGVPGGLIGVGTQRLSGRTATAIVRGVVLKSLAPTPAPSAPAPVSPSRTQRADLDGDGRADTVSVQWVKHNSSAPWSGVVRVDIAFRGGGHASYDLPIKGWVDPANQEQPTTPAWGTSQVNSIGGLEIVVTTDDVPASFTSYRVLTVTPDQIVHALPPPPGQTTWQTGSSVATGALGYQCNEATLVRMTSVPVRQGYGVRSDTYRWTGTSWSQLGTESSKHRRAGPDGWNCYGLEGL